MKKIEIVKAVGEAVVSLGVGAIVANLIRATTPTNVRVFTKICIGVGGMVLTSMATDAATDYTEKKFNNAITQVKKMVIESE